MNVSARERALARIAHDVGKHVARAAVNVRDGEPVPRAVVDMLAKDLYALRDGARASEVLARMAGEAGLSRDPAVVRCATLLAEADSIEAAVREGREPAVARAARLACEVRAVLAGGER